MLARPDSIQVEFNGDSTRRKIGARSRRADRRRQRRPSTGTTPRRPASSPCRCRPRSVDQRGEPRWRLDGLNGALAHFTPRTSAPTSTTSSSGLTLRSHGCSGASLTGSSAPASSPTTIMTPENKAVLITTAEPTVAPRFLREPLDLNGHRRPRVLVLDTGLRTAANGKENDPEHAFLRSPDPHRPRVHLHDEWESNPTSRRSTTRTSQTTTVPVCSTSRPDTERSSPGSSARSVRTPTSFRPGCCRASARARSLACGRRSADDQVVRTVRHRRDELRDVLHQRRSRTVRRPAAAAGRRRRRGRRGGQSAVVPAVLSGGAARRGRRRRVGSWRTGVVLQLRQLGRRLRAGGQCRQHVLQRLHRDRSAGDRDAATESGHGGAEPASPRRRSPGRSPRRCT